MAEKNGKNNIIQYKKPLNINLTMIVFILIFLYLIVIVYGYMTSTKIASYEVKRGSLAIDNTFKGICLRNELVVNAAENGYVNYYAREGERVAKNAMVYTVDESGKLNDIILSQTAYEDSLANADLYELRNEAINYRNSYRDSNFDSVYDFKHNVEGAVQKLANRNILSGLSQLQDQSVMDLVDFSYAQESGILVYSTDGYENITTADITEDTLSEENIDNYQKMELMNGDLTAVGDPVYKLITEDPWSVVIYLESDEQYEALKDETYVKVRFLKTGDESWGAVTVYDKEDKHFCILSFTNSMVTFCKERFLDVELLINNKEGLKIPTSAIVQRDFYLIPSDYITVGGDSEETKGFMRESVTEDGQITTEFVPVDIYHSSDDYYYVDISAFRLGDKIKKKNSNDEFVINSTDKATLEGVYNMNKGYADFTEIEVLSQNKEYAIIQANTQYGLSVYDHIVLDGKAVTEDDFVFE